MSHPYHRRILIIDDNPSIHEGFRKILGGCRTDQSSLDTKEDMLFGGRSPRTQLEGFQVDSAYQGEEGIDLIVQALQEGRPYALAFVDIRMPPGWDGIETIERIFPVDTDVHVVICSAHSDYSSTDILLRLGTSDRLLLLRKPCDSAEIYLIATAMCEKWKLTQATGETGQREYLPLANCHSEAAAQTFSS